MIYHLVYGLEQSYMADAVSGGSSFDSPKKDWGWKQQLRNGDGSEQHLAWLVKTIWADTLQ